MSDKKPFRLTVRAVILDDRKEKCLLVRRSNECKGFPGTWEWPGGKTDEGETFDVAVRREVVEETGLEIELTGVAGAFYYEMAHCHVATLCMEAIVAGGTLQLSVEHDQSAWVPLPELPKWSLTPGFDAFARSYVANLSKGA